MTGGELPPFRERLPALREVQISNAMLWAAILMVILGAITSFLSSSYPQDAPLHDDIFAPVLALELPHSAENLRIVLSPPLRRPPEEEESAAQRRDREATLAAAEENRETQIRALFRRATMADFLFIAAYSFFLLTAWKAIVPRGFVFGIVVVAVIALGDVLENLGILRALGTPLNSITDATAAAIATPSIIKWAAYAFVILCFGFALTRVELRPFKRPGTGLLAIELMVAGIVGATGLHTDISSPAWLTGLFSHGHLETFVLLIAVFPLTVIVAEFYRRLRSPRAEPARPEVETA